MKHALILLLLAICMESCTKETYVEGLVPVEKSFDMNSAIPFVNNQVARTTLLIEGEEYTLNFDIRTTKTAVAYPSAGIGINDSILNISLGSSRLLFEIETNAVKKYRKEQQLSASGTFDANSRPFLFAYRKSPYNEGYISLKQHPTAGLVQYSFGMPDEGYVAFKLVKDALTVYGWLHIGIDNKHIYIDKYGYQSFEPGRAG